MSGLYLKFPFRFSSCFAISLASSSLCFSSSFVMSSPLYYFTNFSTEKILTKILEKLSDRLNIQPGVRKTIPRYLVIKDPLGIGDMA